MMNEKEFLAHVRKTPSAEWEKHDLREHLENTANIAKEFADEFNSREWAELAGLWHDLGKFLPEWQAYLRKKSGFDIDAHIETGTGRPNHSTVMPVITPAKK